MQSKLSINKQFCLARIHAHICGDGCVSIYKTGEKDRSNRSEVHYYNTNSKLIDEFREDMRAFFGVKMTFYPKKSCVRVKSIRIVDFLKSLSEFSSYSWRIPSLIKKSPDIVKEQWILAFLKDEGYDYQERRIVRVKSVNLEGLKDVQQLLETLRIPSWRTGKNCDNTWYLNIRKTGFLKEFSKIKSRGKTRGNNPLDG